MSKISATTVLDQVIDLAKDLSDREIIPFFKNISHLRKSDGSPVTAVDASVQSALEDALPKILKAPVLGEEMTNDQQMQIWGQRDTGLWCVDPIDGTTNFVNGIPYFAVSIAYFKGGEPVIGLVLNPITGQVFTAENGGGAWLGGRSLLQNRSRHTSLRECVASVDFKRLPEPLSARLVSSPPYASQRNFGAAALEWCDVASGLFDVYVHGNQKIWDFAAGALILSEAGGVMASFTKGPFWLDETLSRPVIAARDPMIFEEWSNWLALSL
ncbi:MAG: inositol monophosphatase family protein [Burkholderiales bacterium]|nr:inositol monophosphatase family protein [Burkholderiales bacterium]|tara:strand:- start:59 stop:868 length:810 start_codon:yes stop_codon:yes gene_type:complete